MTEVKAQALSLVEGYLAKLQQKWEAIKPTGKEVLKVGTRFILDSLDELIQFVDGLIPSGEDKKKIVMTMVEKLFDTIIYKALPIWMKPFAPAVRKVVLDVIISNAIDFIVGKYRSAGWRPDAQAPAQPQ